MHLAGTLHICPGNVRVRTRAVELLTTLSLRTLLVLLLGVPSSGVFAAQTASSSASQAAINDEIQAAYQAGAAAAANNDFKTAETQLEKVVRLAPQVEEGHSALGAVLARLGKLPQAIKELETALKLKPGDVSAQTNLALAYEQTGANEKAIVLFKKVEADAQRKRAADSSSALPSYVLAAYARSLAAIGQLPAATCQDEDRRRRIAAERRTP